MTAFLTLASIGGLLGMVVLLVRMGGLREDRDKADSARKIADDQLSKVARELKAHQVTSARRIREMRNDIEKLDELFETECVDVGERRALLERLLSAASDGDAEDRYAGVLARPGRFARGTDDPRDGESRD